LAAWSQHARSLPERPTVDVGVSALRDDRLHFLLDGLDEVANDRQMSAASLIAHVAERFPQHAFTVTSRPVPALTALGYGEPAETTAWRVIDLVPGAAWQERYLSTRGVTLDQLEAVIPALTDMRELLRKPFFLTRTVELFENGRLAGLRDVGELLARLIDFSLSREEELLPMLGLSEARGWLRRVALAAAIAGQRTFSFTELEKVNLEDGVAGDLDEFVHQLQLRLLLSEEDGRIRFSHRLIADELVAEALSEMEPVDALLDTLVPVADADLAGVRDDLAIAVSLLCLRSSVWRTAVGRRDALAAVRSTPSDADSTERAAAVTLLWRAYQEWGVWIWDRSVPDLVEDAEVIARLLRQDPDGAQVAELRQVLRDGDEVQQGNAVRVLAGVAPAGLSDDLGTILRDSGRNEVVVRQAALAAASLGLTDLIDDIVFAMLASSDSVLHQETSIALRDLTPDDRLVEVAERLATCVGGNLFVGFVRERLSAVERIEVARGLAKAGVDERSTDSGDLAAAVKVVTPDASVVQAAACAATLWRNDSDEIKALLAHDPHAAAVGLLEAAGCGARWWDIARLAACADLDVLRTGGIDERAVEAAELERKVRAMSAAEREELRAATAPAVGQEDDERGPEPPSKPTLAELLRMPADEAEAALQAEAFGLRREVAALGDEDLLELRTRLASSWPTVPFSDLVTVDGQRVSLRGSSPAWLFLAPDARMPVTDEQWAQLATNPFLHHEQSEWLRLQATEPRMQRALALMTDMRAECWLRLLDCCPAPPPGFIAEASAASVGSDTDRAEPTTYLMQRLVAGGVTEGARAWAARDEVAARALRPMLAIEGDLDAQRRLVSDLLDSVISEPSELPDELGWMSMLRAEEFLEPLFEILGKIYPPSPQATGFGPSVRDVLTPTIEAIAAIGSREAVRRYDVLLARGGDLRWLRGQRDRIAAEVLRACGDNAAPAAAGVTGLPLFQTNG
jgi:hypothetical protein